jgi:AmiR/NasT family two-component response regulator
VFIDSDYQGSLNLYGEHTHGYRELDAALLELYTTAVEAALRADRRYRKARDHAGQLREALTSRAVIDQAKGIIMAARQVDADTAFAVLVQQSQRDNIKLRDLAARFVTNVTSADS